MRRWDCEVGYITRSDFLEIHNDVFSYWYVWWMCGDDYGVFVILIC